VIAARKEKNIASKISAFLKNKYNMAIPNKEAIQ
jgi:hypothetical protein